MQQGTVEVVKFDREVIRRMAFFDSEWAFLFPGCTTRTKSNGFRSIRCLSNCRDTGMRFPTSTQRSVIGSNCSRVILSVGDRYWISCGASSLCSEVEITVYFLPSVGTTTPAVNTTLGRSSAAPAAILMAAGLPPPWSSGRPPGPGPPQTRGGRSPVSFIVGMTKARL